MSLCKTACGAPMPIIVLMCRAVGVCVMLAQEMKCIVGHKKELSNVGAPSFLFPPPEGYSVLCNCRAQGHRSHDKLAADMRLTTSSSSYFFFLLNSWLLRGV